MPILNNSSIEVVYHHYRQVEPQDHLRDARIGAEPEGEKRDIGQEWNFIVGVEEGKHWGDRRDLGPVPGGFGLRSPLR